MMPAALSAVQAQFAERIAWAVVSAELQIESHSDNWSLVLRDTDLQPQVGDYLDALFDEFVGLQDYIANIMRGALSQFRLDRVNRSTPDSGMMYCDFVLRPFGPSNHGQLLLTIEDTTEFGRLEQLLVQERNELRLTRQALARSNEELRRLDNFKALFFSMAAHDLRAPLMTVRGYADLIGMMVRQDDDGVFGEQTGEFLMTIKSQVDWLDQLIHNISDLNRIESDRFELRTDVCNLNDLLRSAVDALRPMADLSEQQLSMEPAPDGVLLKVDATRIEQCISNLIANAVKYTPAGGSIVVRLHVHEDSADIEVRDTGPGIPPDQLPYVFDLYYRSDGAMLSEISGTGLGLYVVRSIVEMHDGTVSASSEVGIGSVFTLSLPRFASAKLATTAQATS